MLSFLLYLNLFCNPFCERSSSERILKEIQSTGKNGKGGGR